MFGRRQIMRTFLDGDANSTNYTQSSASTADAGRQAYSYYQTAASQEQRAYGYGDQARYDTDGYSRSRAASTAEYAASAAAELGRREARIKSLSKTVRFARIDPGAGQSGKDVPVALGRRPKRPDGMPTQAAIGTRFWHYGRHGDVPLLRDRLDTLFASEDIIKGIIDSAFLLGEVMICC